MSQCSFNRRNFLRALGLGAASLSAMPLFAQMKGKSPNVLFIAIDDLNDWIGCMGGHPDVKTPNLDRLADRGMLFTRAYCAAPVCNPSRAALMTGIRPSTSGVYTNKSYWRGSPVLKEAVTIPQHFMQHGYQAWSAGKIFHTPDPPSWQSHFPGPISTRPSDPHLKEMPAGSARNFHWGAVDATDDEMGDMQVAEWVGAKLREKQDEPYFLGCGIFRPHLPWVVPQKYFDMYPIDEVSLPLVNENDLDDVPQAGKEMRIQSDHPRITEAGAWRKAVQAYLASITFADAVLGRVLDAYDASPDKDNTIIVLWADHGWHLGEKLHWRKAVLWEEATRNILLFVAPGTTKPHQICDAPVNLLDIYPTLIDLCGLKKRPELEGNSLLPLLKNPDAKWDTPSLTTYKKDNHSVRSRRWRYIRYADGSEELYDHEQDPYEWKNLAGEPRFASVKEELRKWMPQINAPESPRMPKTEVSKILEEKGRQVNQTPAVTE